MAVGDIVVAIDVERSYISLLMGEINNFNQIDIIHKNTIFDEIISEDINEKILIDTLEELVSNAKEATGLQINSAYVTIPSKYIKIIQKTQIINIKEPINGVTMDDIDQLFKETGREKISKNEVILDIIPDLFVLDNNRAMKDPLGKSTKKLTMLSQIITGDLPFIKRMEAIFRRAQLSIDSFQAPGIFLSSTLFDKQDVRDNILLIDVNEKTTDISIYMKNSIVYAKTIEVGFNTIVEEIAEMLKIDQNEVKSLIKEYPLAMKTYIDNDHNIMLTSMNSEENKTIRKSAFVELVQNSLEKLFKIIKKELKLTGLNDYINTVIVTGNDIIDIDKFDILGQKIFEIVVKKPTTKTYLTIENQYLRVFSLVRYYSQNEYLKTISSDVSLPKSKNIFINLWERIKEFFYT